jgi:hypothetical protein
MTTLREAAQQALDALEAGPDVDPIFAGETEDALRAALVEPVQEPYCYVYEYDGVFGLHREFYPREYNGRKPDRTVPLFTAPPQRKPPTNQCGETCERAKLCAVCARGLEKPEGGGNLPPPLQVPTEVAAENKYGMKEWEVHALRAGWMPTPPHRKPLTEEEIEQINRDLPLLHMQARKGSVAVVFARAIERAHGIT